MSEHNKNTAEYPYSEWMKKIQQASNPKPFEPQEESESDSHKVTLNHLPGEKESKKNRKWIIIVTVILFLVSLAIRLFFIFIKTDPDNAGAGWYNDSYHHWQIAYLTKEIGLGKSFLRLWDLTGLEYFWGLLQPLVLILVFTVTGTADIAVIRILNSVFGSLSYVILFLLIRKHISWQAGLGAAILAILNPIAIFTDTSGMQEPLAILLMLSGVYFWPARPVFTGISWLFASLTRSEYWLFSLGLISSILLFDKKHHKKAFLLFPYIIGILLYMKYLLDKTGNAIYPIYWNYLGNAAGNWQADIALTVDQENIRVVFLILIVISVLTALYLVIKKPVLYIFSLLSTGNLVFLSFFIGFTHYLKSYLPRFWFDRIFLLPYIWLGAVIAVFALYFLPKHIPLFGRIIGIAILGSVVLIMQYNWIPINEYRKGGDGYLISQEKIAREIAARHTSGSILIPGNDPILTYKLYKQGIKGSQILGEMFDPFFYFTDTDPYKNWGKNRKIVFNWLKSEDIGLIIFINEPDNRYGKLVKREKDRFVDLGIISQYAIYKVK